jgi:uracil-DNA glycosylase
MHKYYHNSWKNILEKEFNSEYFPLIEWFLEAEKGLWKKIFPAEENIFNAFNHTSLDNLKVVILGQDPYHGEWQAHGLSFSVHKWIKVPPSLRNIYKELKEEYWYEIPNHWELTSWADQWVLLLNTFLTVESWLPASHAKIGWEQFTNNIISSISKEKEGVVFLLWWAFSQGKKVLINTEKHVILETTHPSPFSAYRGFLGSQCFKKTNEILEENGNTPINWEIADNNEQMSLGM